MNHEAHRNLILGCTGLAIIVDLGSITRAINNLDLQCDCECETVNAQPLEVEREIPNE